MTGDEANAEVSMAISVLRVINQEGVDGTKKRRKELNLVASLSKPAKNTKLELLIAAKEGRASQGLKGSSFLYAARNLAKKSELKFQTWELRAATGEIIPETAATVPVLNLHRQKPLHAAQAQQRVS